MHVSDCDIDNVDLLVVFRLTPLITKAGINHPHDSKVSERHVVHELQRVRRQASDQRQ
ncbi:hypothetical protein D3C73_1649120 [compost metagenome]